MGLTTDSGQLAGGGTGSRQLGLFSRVHCFLLLALQAQGLWGLNLGRLDQVPPQKQGPAASTTASACTCQALPSRCLARAVCLCRAGQGSPGIAAGFDRTTNIAVTFLWHISAAGLPLPRPPLLPPLFSSPCAPGTVRLAQPGGACSQRVPGPAPAVPSGCSGVWH